MTVRRSTQPPVPSALPTTKRPSSCDLDDGEADVREVRHVLDARVGEVAAAHLRAAFQQVAGHRAGGQRVPVVFGPAEVRQAGPSASAGSATRPVITTCAPARRACGDFAGAEVDVGADQGRAGQGRRQDSRSGSAAGSRAGRRRRPPRCAAAGRPSAAASAAGAAAAPADWPRRSCRRWGCPPPRSPRSTGRTKRSSVGSQPAVAGSAGAAAAPAPACARPASRTSGRPDRRARERAHHGDGGIPAVAGETRAAADAQAGHEGKDKPA